MPRGFIKPVAGKMRMRLVRQGYDADNLALDPNVVVFDSEALSNVSVYTKGIFIGSASLPNAYVKLASWPAMGFVPVVHFEYVQDVQAAAPLRWRPFILISSGDYKLDVTEDGFYSGSGAFQFFKPRPAESFRPALRYTVLNLPLST